MCFFVSGDPGDHFKIQREFETSGPLVTAVGVIYVLFSCKVVLLVSGKSVGRWWWWWSWWLWLLMDFDLLSPKNVKVFQIYQQRRYFL